MALNNTDRQQYQQVQEFKQLIQLNEQFLRNPSTTTSPFTLKLESETSSLISQLIEVNQLGMLTTSSSPLLLNEDKTVKKRAYLLGIVNSDSAEKLELLLNQQDGVIAFILPCKTSADEDDEDYVPDSVEIPKFPVAFEQGEVKEYVTCFNWWALLKPTLDAQVYSRLGSKSHNLYIIDTSKQGETQFMNRVIQVLKQTC